MPTKYCKDCSLKLGFFKKKFVCGLCLCHYCNQCFQKVKANEQKLTQKLKYINTPSCLKCIVFHNEIQREHLFLLQNKQIAEFLTLKRISVGNCIEKYHLIDLVMEFAETHGMRNGHEIESEILRRTEIQELREAERLRQLEEEERRNMNETNDEHPNNIHEEEYAGSPSSKSSISDIEPNSSACSNELSSPEVNITSPDTNETFKSGNQNSLSKVDDDEQNEFDVSNENTRNSVDSVNIDSNLNNAAVAPTMVYQSEENSVNGGLNSLYFENGSSNPVGASSVETNQAEQSYKKQMDNKTTPVAKKRNHDSKSQASGNWCSVDDIQQQEDIYELSVRELKQILTANFVDYRGCVEKQELIDKVTQLYLSERKAEDVKAESDASYERDLCKICMDHTIDCVLLNCGHLVSCTKCGKRLAYCPICRSHVVRVVHVFRV